MRTVKDLLCALGACKRAKEKYSKYNRAFKTAFINAHWKDAEWFVQQIFSQNYIINEYGRSWKYIPYPVHWKYKRFPFKLDYAKQKIVSAANAGIIFRKKKNREEYWPEIRKRLIEIGVGL
jgi:hypothetical protein